MTDELALALQALRVAAGPLYRDGIEADEILTRLWPVHDAFWEIFRVAHAEAIAADKQARQVPA